MKLRPSALLAFMVLLGMTIEGCADQRTMRRAKDLAEHGKYAEAVIEAQTIPDNSSFHDESVRLVSQWQEESKKANALKAAEILHIQPREFLGLSFGGYFSPDGLDVFKNEGAYLVLKGKKELFGKDYEFHPVVTGKHHNLFQAAFDNIPPEDVKVIRDGFDKMIGKHHDLSDNGQEWYTWTAVERPEIIGSPGIEVWLRKRKDVKNATILIDDSTIRRRLITIF